MILPCTSSTTRFCVRSTMVTSCVAMTTVVPCWLMRSSTCMMPSLVRGSRLPVGSSASSDRRLVHDRAGDRDALLLAAGELAGIVRRLLREADRLEHVRDGRLDEAARLPDDLEGERDVVVDGLVRQQPEVLEHHAEAAAEVGHLAGRDRGQPLAEHVDLARRGLLLAQHQPQQAGLAAAGRAHQEDELAGADLERHVVQRRARSAAITLGHGVEADHVGSHHRCGSRARRVRQANSITDIHVPCARIRPPRTGPAVGRFTPPGRASASGSRRTGSRRAPRRTRSRGCPPRARCAGP